MAMTADQSNRIALAENLLASAEARLAKAQDEMRLAREGRDIAVLRLRYANAMTVTGH